MLKIKTNFLTQNYSEYVIFAIINMYFVLNFWFSFQLKCFNLFNFSFSIFLKYITRKNKWLHRRDKTLFDVVVKMENQLPRFKIGTEILWFFFLSFETIQFLK